MPKDLITKNWGSNPIDLRDKLAVWQMRPTELHHKEDGTLTNKPSFCFILSPFPDANFKYVVAGEVSLDMLNEAMKELGYKIVSNEQ